MIEESLSAGPSAPTAARLIEAELLRVRLKIAALQAEETELATARAVLERLVGGHAVPFEEALELDFGTFTSSPPSGSTEVPGITTDVCGWVAPQASETLTNVGAIDVHARADESRECRPVEAEAAASPAQKPNKRGFVVGDGEPSKPLFDALKAEGARRGLTTQQLSIQVWNNKARIYQLTAAETVRKSTAERIRAWLEESRRIPAPPEASPVKEAGAKGPAGEAPSPPASEPAVAPPTGERLPIAPTPSELARSIGAFLARHGVSASAFGKAVNGDPALVKAIRAGRAPRRKTIEKLRALLDDPPATLLNVQYRATRAQARGATRPRDPTQKPCSKAAPSPTVPAPASPLMDAGERQRQNGQRFGAEVRRAQEREAAQRLDAGEKPRSSFERTQMAHIERRRADEARLADPTEQAKLALQRKGLTVYSASVTGGRKDRFIVSGQQKELTPAELIDLAERKTGMTFRRSLAAPSHANPAAPSEQGRPA